MPDSPHPVESSVPRLVAQIYTLVAEFERLFPGRRFTPDGHLIGSIGEVVAAHRYNLELLPNSTKGHDAVSASGVLVQIKATQGTSVAMREEPQHLLVLHLARSGQASEVFNGPGPLAWAASGAMQRNGQRPISLSKLRSLMSQVPNGSSIPERS